MEKHLNYEDSIFLLNVRIRLIQDAVILEADPGLFLGQTFEDLAFINTSLIALFESLTTNNRLLDRDEQLFNLSETERVFCGVLTELSRGKSALGTAMDEQTTQLAADMKNCSLERRRALDEMIAEFKSSHFEPLVGYEELQELLSM